MASSSPPPPLPPPPPLLLLLLMMILLRSTADARGMHEWKLMDRSEIDPYSSRSGAEGSFVTSDANAGSMPIRKLLQLASKDKSRQLGKSNSSPSKTSILPSFSQLFSTVFSPSPLKSLVASPSSNTIIPSESFLPSPFKDHGSPLPALFPATLVSASVSPSPRTSTASPHDTPTITTFPKNTPSLVARKTHTHQYASWKIYVSVATGASFLLTLSAVYFLCYRTNKVVTVRPWPIISLSGQLRKAFVTGVPSLKQSELKAACEDFSNIIGSLSSCVLYKGTLSSGVEIAVRSTVITSQKDWSKEQEIQFRKKISLLSKVNHKNFVNLLGFCKEEDPFTRMMVFEYSPNGTLFEHLHIKEAEHLDWCTRLRIAMGVAYCLEHMLQFDPPVILRNLDSSSIYLTDDFAAKISDLAFCTNTNEIETASESDSSTMDIQVSCPEDIVYRFGILLLEILSGKRPFSKDDGLLVLWASSYLDGKRPLRDMIDPTLESFHEEQVVRLCELIRSCISVVPKERANMSEAASQLKGITAMLPDGAAPKPSPLWWAELEIHSSDTY